MEDQKIEVVRCCSSRLYELPCTQPAVGFIAHPSANFPFCSKHLGKIVAGSGNWGDTEFSNSKGEIVRPISKWK